MQNLIFTCFLAFILPQSAFAKFDSCEGRLRPAGGYSRWMSRDGIEMALRIHEDKGGDLWIGSLNYADDSEPLYIELSPGYVNSARQLTLFGQGVFDGISRKVRIRLTTADSARPEISGIFGIQIETPNWLGLDKAIEWKWRGRFIPRSEFRVPENLNGAEAQEIFDLLRAHGVPARNLFEDLKFNQLENGLELDMEAVGSEVQFSHFLRILRQSGLRADHPIFRRLSFIEPG